MSNVSRPASTPEARAIQDSLNESLQAVHRRLRGCEILGTLEKEMADVVEQREQAIVASRLPSIHPEERVLYASYATLMQTCLDAAKDEAARMADALRKGLRVRLENARTRSAVAKVIDVIDGHLGALSDESEARFWLNQLRTRATIRWSEVDDEVADAPPAVRRTPGRPEVARGTLVEAIDDTVDEDARSLALNRTSLRAEALRLGVPEKRIIVYIGEALELEDKAPTTQTAFWAEVARMKGQPEAPLGPLLTDGLERIRNGKAVVHLAPENEEFYRKTRRPGFSSPGKRPGGLGARSKDSSPAGDPATLAKSGRITGAVAAKIRMSTNSDINEWATLLGWQEERNERNAAAIAVAEAAVDQPVPARLEQRIRLYAERMGTGGRWGEALPPAQLNLEPVGSPPPAAAAQRATSGSRPAQRAPGEGVLTGADLIRIRTARRKTQTEMAVALGANKSTVSRAEARAQEPLSPDLAAKLGQVLRGQG
jgi:DNA-binding XRE family transcriptional regulator